MSMCVFLWAHQVGEPVLWGRLGVRQQHILAHVLRRTRCLPATSWLLLLLLQVTSSILTVQPVSATLSLCSSFILSGAFG